MATQTTIREAVLAILAGGGFAGIPVVNIIARKLPKVDEVIDHLPGILLASPDRDTQRKPTSTEDNWDIVYPFEICRVVASNRDLSPDPLTEQFTEIVRQLFAPQTYTSMPTVWMAEIDVGHLYDRSMLSAQYSYTSMVLKLTSNEVGG